jgi:hypothetical protein
MGLIQNALFTAMLLGFEKAIGQPQKTPEPAWHTPEHPSTDETTRKAREMATTAQKQPQSRPLPLFVHTYPWPSGECSSAVLPVALRGSVKKNVAPWPGSDSTQMRPPWRSTTFLQIANPMPVPGCSRGGRSLSRG